MFVLRASFALQDCSKGYGKKVLILDQLSHLEFLMDCEFMEEP